MPTATVTVEYVNPPAEGKKMGNIKTKELGYINVWPNKLPLFQKGGVYTLDYVEQGKFKTFSAMAGTAMPAHELPPAAVQAAALPPVFNSPAPPPPPTAAPQPTRAVDPTPERIYVCGIVNQAIASGQYQCDAATLVTLTKAAREAWRLTLGAL